MGDIPTPTPNGTATATAPATAPTTTLRMRALYLLLGFCAGLPFYMFSTVLMLRLTAHGVGIVVIGFFAWVQLLPTFKFLWAPVLDRYAIPGCGRFWGKRRGWIMLAQLGIVSAMVALAFTADTDLRLTALFAVLLAFWTTNLEIAADAWRIELAPTQAQQAPLAAANLWGYRTAMVAAGSGALLIADQPGLGWTAAYLGIASAAFAPFPVLAAMRSEHGGGGGGRGVALATGLLAAILILAAVAVAFSGLGMMLFAVATALGIGAQSNVTPWVLGLCMLPFLAMAVAVPRIRKLGPDAPLRRSVALGPYVDFFWRFGAASLVVMAFVSLNRMGDVLALNLSKPMIKELGYTLTQIGRADSFVALAASILGVGLGGWAAARWPLGRALALGAATAALGNFGFVWLAAQPVSEGILYLATAADQFGNGLAGTVFVVYLSLLVNPRYPAAQYAFLSGFAFLLARLLSGAGGAMVARIGYDNFFLLSGALSLAAIPLIPWVMRIRARADDRLDDWPNQQDVGA